MIEAVLISAAALCASILLAAHTIARALDVEQPAPVPEPEPQPAVIDWPAVVGAGVTAVFVKATDGTGLAPELGSGMFTSRLRV